MIQLTLQSQVLIILWEDSQQMSLTSYQAIKSVHQPLTIGLARHRRKESLMARVKMTVAADQLPLVSLRTRQRLPMVQMRRGDPSSYLLSQDHRQVRTRLKEDPKDRMTDPMPHMVHQVPDHQLPAVTQDDLHLRTALQTEGSQDNLQFLIQAHPQVKIGLEDLARDRLDRQTLHRFSMILREDRTVQEVPMLATLLICHLNRTIHRIQVDLVDPVDGNELVLTLLTQGLRIMTHQDLKVQMTTIDQGHIPQLMITMATDQQTLTRPKGHFTQLLMAEMTQQNQAMVEPAIVQLALVDRPALSQTRL